MQELVGAEDASLAIEYHDDGLGGLDEAIGEVFFRLERLLRVPALGHVAQQPKELSRPASFPGKGSRCQLDVDRFSLEPLQTHFPVAFRSGLLVEALEIGVEVALSLGYEERP